MASRNSLLLLALVILAVLSLGLLWMPGDEIGLLVPEHGIDSINANEVELSSEAESSQKANRSRPGYGFSMDGVGRSKSTAPLSRECHLQVYDLDLKEVISGAVVYFTTEVDFKSHQKDANGFSFRNPWLCSDLDFLQKATTGPDGTLVLEVIGDGVWAYSTVGQARGFQFIDLASNSDDLASAPHRLSIQKCISISIQVQQLRGEPAANVPVRLYAGCRQKLETVDIAQPARTNLQGKVMLDIPLAKLEKNFWGEKVAFGCDELKAEVQLPFLKVPAKSLSPTARGPQSTTVRLPKFGAIEVELLNSEKRNALYLKRDAEGLNRWQDFDSSTQIRPGVWKFDYVPLDQDFAIGWSNSYLIAQEDADPQVVWKGGGPVRSGQTISITLDPNGAGFLSGRLLMQDGNPLAATDFHLSLVDASGRRVEEECHQKTQEDGSFRVYATAGGRGSKQAVQAWVRIHPSDTLDYQRGVTVTDYLADLPTGWESSGLDLGELKPQTRSVWVSGMVVDSITNKPLSGSVVYVLPKVGNAGAPSSKRVSRPGRGSLFSVRTAKDGKFTVLQGSALGSPKNQLNLVADGYVTKSVEFVIGQKDLVIPMEEYGWVEFSAVTSSTRNSGLKAVLKKLGEVDAEIGNSLNFELKGESESGLRLLTDLAPGLYSFELGETLGSPFLKIEGVEVLSGKTTRDPRLQRIRVEDSSETITVSLVDGAGEPFSADTMKTLPRIQVRRIRAMGGRIKPQILEGSKISFTQRQGTYGPLRIRVNGYRTVKLNDISNGDVITLEKLPILQIHIGGTNSIPTDSKVHIAMVPRRESDSKIDYFDQSWTWRVMDHLVENGKAQYFVDEPGQYLMIWVISGPNGKRQITQDIDIKEIHLSDGISVQIPSEIFY